MPEFRFVERTRELERLESFLGKALGGNGLVVFIAGEPGSGKTALLREFAKRAERSYPECVFAVGGCNAQTGVGDPYLPFREILALLSGDVEAKVAQGAITGENAKRIRSALQVSGQALVEMGPVLINTLVPGSILVASAARFLAKKAGWLSALEKQEEKKTTEPADTSMDQSRLFEQYTNVLRSIAAKHPLLIAVDDLQWADAGSVNLLFHLGRRIEASNILLVGCYRPEEISLGRGGERHPLEKVLAEFKRNYGDITIDLGEAQKSEGRRFVDAVLDTESNCLEEGFREALFRHTNGHALFTIELLRAMQDRGELERDYTGRWTVTTNLDWTKFPARVEGVIEERIGRLEENLRETLRIASVEGEDFTAQIIARVQETRERQLLHDLSEELEKRHRLVQEQGEVRVNREILSHYRFAHALFQRYLYNDLSAGERRLLHRDMARVLEDLYSGCTDQVTVQLARHYDEAGDAENAVRYLLEAGHRARSLYANEEAIAHYMRARGLYEAEASCCPPTGASQLYEGLGDVQELGGQHQAARDAYKHAQQLIPTPDCVSQARLRRKDGRTYMAQRECDRALNEYDAAESALGPRGELPDRAWVNEWLELNLDRGWAYYMAARVPEMVKLAAEIRPEVEAHGTPLQKAVFSRNMVLMALRRDRYLVSDETLGYARMASEASHASADKVEIALSDFVLAFCHLWRWELDEAEAGMQAVLRLAQQIGDVEREVLSLSYLTVTNRKMGRIDRVKEYIPKSLAVSTQAGMSLYVDLAKANQSWVALREGDTQCVIDLGKTGFETWHRLGVPNPLKWTVLFPLMAVCLLQGREEEAIGHARTLLQPPEMRMPADIEQCLQAGVCAWEGGDTVHSRECLSCALELARPKGYV